MKVRACCPGCLGRSAFDTSQPPAELECRCGARRTVTVSASIRERDTVDVCALCGGGYFYVEKAVNGWVALGVIVGAVVASTWAYGHSLFLALGILGGAALLDLAMYAILPARTVCYACLAEYRGGRRNPEHGAYDLGIAGRFADDFEERRAKSR